ncbi:MAG: cation diffusion facilitator family transporter [Gammaproteobacteria bacterium]|nr:cation diffusion facilitator family transporter [Gammaproteobacteria bacterium]
MTCNKHAVTPQYRGMDISLEQRQKETNRVTIIGVIVNIILAISKLVAGFAANSHALIADGFHSFSDLISDAMVLYAAKHSNQEADEEHPYGHARYETLATIGVGLFLILVAAGIAIDAIESLVEPAALSAPGAIALWIAAFSIVSNEGLFQITIRAARRIKSKMLKANAWHHRTDSISSIVVFIGIAGAMIGWPILDDIAAILVALMIAKIGWDLSHQSIQELVDTALEPETIDKIKQHIKNVDGVQEMHMLRSRRMGHNALVDVHILVDSRLSVSEGHQISEAVAYSLVENFDDINDVTVHIDPEDDEHAPNSCKDLPLRSEVMTLLTKCWEDIAETQHISDTTLHYLDGKIDIEITLPLDILDTLESASALKAKIQSASKHLAFIRDVSVYFT